MSDKPSESISLDRRNLLRLVMGSSLTLLAPQLLAGCGGGDGNTGGGAGSVTRQATFSVNASEIGGNGLELVNRLNGNIPLATTGTTPAPISGNGAQIHILVDQQGKVRAGAVSAPTTSSPALTFDATSTALTKVFLTPGLMTLAPAGAAQSLQVIQSLPSFAPLVTYLRQKLPTTPLNDLSTEAQFVSLTDTCINDWMALSGRSVKTRASGPGDFSATLNSNSTAARANVDVQNKAWRYLDVVRQPLNSLGNVDASLSREFAVNGGAGLSVGTILTGTVSFPGKATDTLALSQNQDVNVLRYWYHGPGNRLLGEMPPPGVTFDENVWGRSVVLYALFPLIDFVLGVGLPVGQAAAEAANQVWTKFGAAISLGDIISATDARQLASAIVDVLIALIAVIAGILALLGIGGAVTAVAAVIAGTGAFLGAVNIVIFAVQVFAYPAYTFVDVSLFPFAGHYAGTSQGIFQEPTGPSFPVSATFDANVDNHGVITGTVNDSLGNALSVSGNVDRNGVMKFGTAGTFNVTATFTGTISSDGGMSGSYVSSDPIGGHGSGNFTGHKV